MRVIMDLSQIAYLNNWINNLENNKKTYKKQIKNLKNVKPKFEYLSIEGAINCRNIWIKEIDKQIELLYILKENFNALEKTEEKIFMGGN